MKFVQIYLDLKHLKIITIKNFSLNSEEEFLEPSFVLRFLLERNLNDVQMYGSVYCKF